MAVKNLQTVAVCVANIHGVRVTGTERKGSMRQREQTASLSLPRLSLPGSYPAPMSPDADLRADNAAAALGLTRAGRSVSESAELARTAGGTILSKRWSPSKFWTNPVRG